MSSAPPKVFSNRKPDFVPALTTHLALSSIEDEHSESKCMDSFRHRALGNEGDFLGSPSMQKAADWQWPESDPVFTMRCQLEYLEKYESIKLRFTGSFNKLRYLYITGYLLLK